jgi:RimJ/RimL family protein N-acetyltransferase
MWTMPGEGGTRNPCDHGRVPDEELVTLPDGATVRIRPLAPADAPALLRGLEHLSPRSRYRRFLGAPRIGPSELRYLTDVDHRDHEALGAADPATGEGIAVARYIREPGGDSAEIAVTVDDAWQGRGVGTALLLQLADRARAAGIRRFTGLVLAENAPMRALMAKLGAPASVNVGDGTVEATVDL